MKKHRTKTWLVDASMRRRLYQRLLPVLREAARRLGYALGVHGSMGRDLDLIAAPWTRDAVSPEELVEEMKRVSDGFVINNSEADPHDYTQRNPEPKPHGRSAWSIHLRAAPECYIDLSIMPLARTPE